MQSGCRSDADIWKIRIDADHTLVHIAGCICFTCFLDLYGHWCNCTCSVRLCSPLLLALLCLLCQSSQNRSGYRRDADSLQKCRLNADRSRLIREKNGHIKYPLSPHSREFYLSQTFSHTWLRTVPMVYNTVNTCTFLLDETDDELSNLELKYALFVLFQSQQSESEPLMCVHHHHVYILVLIWLADTGITIEDSTSPTKLDCQTDLRNNIIGGKGHKLILYTSTQPRWSYPMLQLVSSPLFLIHKS